MKVYTLNTARISVLNEMWRNVEADYTLINTEDNVSTSVENCIGFRSETYDTNWFKERKYVSVSEAEFIDKYSILCSNSQNPPIEETNTFKKETEGKLGYELDFDFIKEMAVRMDKNDKYPPYNWKKPINTDDLNELKKALFRHVMEVMQEKYEDDGEDLGHFTAIATNAMIIHYQLKSNNSDEYWGI